MAATADGWHRLGAFGAFMISAGAALAFFGWMGGVVERRWKAGKLRNLRPSQERAIRVGRRRLLFGLIAAAVGVIAVAVSLIR